MPRRFITDIDLLSFALLNARLHPVSADPSGLGAGDEGRVWYNTTTDKLMFWNGSAAIDVTARANHTGTQLASTISDFMATVFTARHDQLAVPTGPVAWGGQKITGLADGTAGSDAASYGQVLALINNQIYKAPVRAATTANIASLAGGAPNTLDGVALAVNDRVLVKDQTAAATNGVYTVTTVGTGSNGTWARAGDADSAAELPPGAIVPVTEGTAGGDKLYMLTTNGPITLGTTSLAFLAYGASTGEIGVAGAGLTKTGVTYDVVGGTGITVAADLVSVDTARIPRKWQGAIPTSSSTVDGLPITVSGAVVTFNHAAGNLAPLVVIRYGSAGTTPGQRLEADDSAGDANNVTITLPAAPGANVYTFMVVA